MAKTVESCSKEVHRCAQLVTWTMERLEHLEKKVACGLACLEARIDANMTLAESDMVESRITDRVMMNINDEHKRKMAEEDKHGIGVSAHSVRNGCSAASTATASSGSGQCSGIGGEGRRREEE